MVRRNAAITLSCCEFRVKPKRALSGCMVITLYIHDTTWLPPLCKYNFFLCLYWQMKRTTGGVAAFTLTQILLSKFHTICKTSSSSHTPFATVPTFANAVQPKVHYFAFPDWDDFSNQLLSTSGGYASCQTCCVIVSPHSHRLASLQSERNQVN